MIKSVLREHHYPPQVIDALFVDAIDYHGLEFLYNDILEVSKEIETKSKAT